MFAGDRVGNEVRNEQVAPLRAVLLLALEQPLPATEPSGRGTGFSAHHHVVSDPAGAVHGARDPAGVEVGVMRALEGADVILVAAKHVGRCRE